MTPQPAASLYVAFDVLAERRGELPHLFRTLSERLAFLREVQRPAIWTASQMQRQLGIVPVVVIPYVAAPVAIYRRMGLAGGLVGAVALLMWYASAQEDWLAPGAMSKLMRTELPGWLASDAAQ